MLLEIVLIGHVVGNGFDWTRGCLIKDVVLL